MAKSFKIVDGDIVLVNGVPEYVLGSDKLKQDIMECLMIEKMENGFGAGIVNMENMSVLDVRSGILDSLFAMRNLQLRGFLVKRDWSDVLGKVESLDVKASKTNVIFSLVVRSMSNQSLALSGVY